MKVLNPAETTNTFARYLFDIQGFVIIQRTLGSGRVTKHPAQGFGCKARMLRNVHLLVMLTPMRRLGCFPFVHRPHDRRLAVGIGPAEPVEANQVELFMEDGARRDAQGLFRNPGAEEHTSCLAVPFNLVHALCLAPTTRSQRYTINEE